MNRIDKDRLVIQSIVACIGAAGIIDTLLSCGGLSAQKIAAYITAVVFAVFFVVCMNKGRNGKIVIFSVLGGVLIITLAAWKSIYEGICFIVNDVINTLTATGMVAPEKISVPDYYKYSKQQIMWKEDIALLLCAIIIALTVSIIVVYLKSVLCAIISILPFGLIFLAYNIVPGIISVFLCITYVFAVAAFKRKGSDYYSPKMIVVISTICAVLCILVVNPTKYKSFAVFNINVEQVGLNIYEMYLKQLHWSFLDELFIDNDSIELGEGDGQVGKSVISDGYLGNVDSIEYNNEDLFTVYTYDTGRTLYMPEMYGISYSYSENKWEREAFVSTADIKTKWELFSMIEYNESMKDYIAEDIGEYDSLVKPYKYKKVQQIAGKTKTTEVYNFVVNENCYKKFAEIADMEEVFTTKISWNEKRSSYTCTQQEYSSLENKQRENTSKYKKISDEHIEIIHSLIGVSQVNTYEEKMNYIRKVKEFLINNYTYTISPGHVPAGKDFAEYFLTESKQGYCTYFATAATLMFRAMGLRARYVEGYVVTSEEIQKCPYTLVDNDAYAQIAPTRKAEQVKEYQVNVKDGQAHAWVEVYMDGYGWVVVEVTPPNVQNGILGTNDNTVLNDVAQETPTVDQRDDEIEKESEPSEQPTQLQNDTEKKSPDIKLTAYIAKHKNKLIVMAIAFVLVTAALTYAVRRYLYRTRRINRALVSSDVIQMYACLEELLACTIYKHADVMTYEEYADYLESENDIFRDNAFKDMIFIVLKARFGGQNVVISEEERLTVKESVSSIRNELIAQMPGYKRIWIKYIAIL